MSIPALPPAGSEDWYAHYSAIDQAARTSAAGAGAVPLEAFPGATDDAKLTAAMTQISGETYKRSIGLFENREYNFSIPRNLYSGFKLVGPPGFGNQYRGALSTQQRVNISGTGPWLNLNQSQTFDVAIIGLSFYSMSSTTDFLAGNGNVLWTSLFRDLGFSLFRHVFGNATESLALTGNQFDGWWNINNARNISVRIGGSDNVLWPQQCLLDSPNSMSTTVPYHLWCDYLEKTTIGNVFITGENTPAAVRVTGSNSSGTHLIFAGTRMEGRNAGASSYGSISRIEGGKPTFRDCWISYAYSAPGSSGRSNEGGVVTCLGGESLFDGCFYSRAGTDGVGVEVPWIYATGSNTKVIVRNARTADDGGTWGSNKPVVRAINGATADVDDSVTLVTV